MEKRINAIEFSNKRVGSTFLQRAIDTHPKIKGIDEVFVNVARKPGMRKSGFVPFVRSDIKDAGEYIQEVIWKTYPDYNTIFKLMYNQVDFHGGLIRFIRENNIPMIHLMRKNLVKQVISGQNAAYTNHNPVALSPSQLMNMVKLADRQNSDFANMFSKNIKLTLYYEDIIGKRKNNLTFVEKSVNRKICNFFKVEEFPMYSDTKKKNKNDISVYLTNIDDIRKYFKKTKYEWMVKE